MTEQPQLSQYMPDYKPVSFDDMPNPQEVELSLHANTVPKYNAEQIAAVHYQEALRQEALSKVELSPAAQRALKLEEISKVRSDYVLAS